MVEIVVRPAKAEDLQFIFASWLKTYQPSLAAQKISKPIFFAKHQKVIEAILLRPETTAYIGHPRGEPDIILGYLVHEVQDQDVVHFMFVKQQFRKLGIARELLKHAQIGRGYFTHWTKWTDHTWGKFQLTYDPYRI